MSSKTLTQNSAEDPFISPPEKVPFVSIVVPVYNDESRIGKCIESLLNQSFRSDKYEILVIDNGSTDNTPETVGNYDVKFLRENTIQSSYAARNKGIMASRGEVIAFTDADCIPAPDWISKGVEHLLRVPDCGLVAGRIKLTFKDPLRPTPVETYESIMRFRQWRYVKYDKYGATANLFTFRRVFEKVGLFNDRLKSGGDNEWGRRVHTFGYKLFYAHDASVDHPARRSLTQLYNRIIRLTGGEYGQPRRRRFFFLRGLSRSLKTLVSVSFSCLLGRKRYLILNGIRQKIYFLLVCIYVEIIRTLERLRLAAGRLPRR